MSQLSTSCSNQPMEDLPILNGLGKVLSWRGDFGSSQSYMVERAMPILAMRVFGARDFDGVVHGVLLMMWWVVSSEGRAS